MRRHRLLLGLVALAIIAAACGGGAQPTAEDATPPTAAETSTSASSGPATHGAASGDPAQQLFAFQAPRVTGGTYDATQLSGRDVAIWFWAPW